MLRLCMVALAAFVVWPHGVLKGPRQGASPSAAIVVRVDPRVELVAAIFRLAGIAEYSESMLPAHVKDVDRFFGPFRNHEAVKLAAQLSKTDGIRFNAPMDVALRMMDAPGLRAVAPLDASTARLVFVTYAVGLPQARKVEVLIDSIRTFAGAYAAAPVYVAADPAASSALSTSRQTAVHLVGLAVPEIARDVPLAVKAYAAAQVEGMLPPHVDTMLWMDPETVVLSPPLGLVLEAKQAVAMQPVFLLNRVGLPPDRPVDGYWSRVYREAGVNVSTLPTLQASADQGPVRFYINCGVIAYRPAKRLCAEWARALTAVLSDTTYRREHVADPLHAVFLHQAVLSAVIAARTLPGERRWIPINHGYPLGQHERLPAERRVKRLNDVACLIYDQVWDAGPGWMSAIPADEPLRTWLRSAHSRAIMPQPSRVAAWHPYPTSATTSGEGLSRAPEPGDQDRVPGVEPVLFAPGVVSTESGVEFCGSPTPDGREFYFTVRRQPRVWEIRFVRWRALGWSAPRVVSFSGQFSDLEPLLGAGRLPPDASVTVTSARASPADERPSMPRRSRGTSGSSTSWSGRRRCPRGQPGRVDAASLRVPGRMCFRDRTVPEAHLLVVEPLGTTHPAEEISTVETAPLRMTAEPIGAPRLRGSLQPPGVRVMAQTSW